MVRKASENLMMSLLYLKAFSPEQCDKIIRYSQSLANTPAELNYGDVDYSKRKSIIKTLEVNESTTWIFDRMLSVMLHVDQKYFNFDVKSIEKLQYLEYTEGDHFHWHMDEGASPPFSMRKITGIVFLSGPEDYQGGELEIIPVDKNKTPAEKGFMVVFPSFKTHRVAPVKKGKRRTLVCWALNC